MRKVWLICAIAVVLIVVGATVVPRGHAARPLSLARAAAQTIDVRSQRFVSEVEIVKDGQRYVLHIGGGVAPGAASMHVRIAGGPAGGQLTPIGGGAELVDGPFLYLHAPGGVSINGLSWLRVRMTYLPRTSSAVRMLRVLKPAPLLQILEVAKPTAVAEPSGVVHGTVAYDDPVVIRSLQQLTDRMQFRHLQLTAVIGADGLVHRLRLTGSTADGSARLRIDSRLSGFGRPMHVPQPPQGSFLDQQELRLAT